MRGILAEINVGKQLRAFLAIWATEAWRDLWSALGLSVARFPSLGLSYDASDASNLRSLSTGTQGTRAVPSAEQPLASTTRTCIAENLRGPARER
jgi:hypothetical protein